MSNSKPLSVKEELVDADYGDNPSFNPVDLQTAMTPAASYLKFSRDIPRSRDYNVPQNSCEVCQGEFADRENLQCHKLLHFNTSHVCYLCDCYFVSTDTLIMHMATMHRGLKATNQGHKNEGCFICSICLQRFSSNKILLRHHNLHRAQEENSYGCKVCGLDFIGYRALLAHLNASRHKEMKVKIQSIFVCVDCRSIFASRDSYAMHMMVRAQNESCDMKQQLDSMPLPDDRCLREASQAAAAAIASKAMSPMHIQNPYGSNPTGGPVPLNLSGCDTSPKSGHVVKLASSQHECHECGAQFDSRGALAIHMMIHAQSDGGIRKNSVTSDSTVAVGFPRRSSLAPPPPPPPPPPLPPQARPSSAPVPAERGGTIHTGIQVLSQFPLHLPHASVWSCNLCELEFDSCDSLAMHMMEKHAHEDLETNLVPTSVEQTEEQIVAALAMARRKSESMQKALLVSKKVTVNGLGEDREHETVSMESGKPGALRARNKRSLSEEQKEVGPKRCRSANNELFRCIACGTHFGGSMELERHTLNKHGGRTATCSTCDMVFLSDFALQSHTHGEWHQLMSHKQYLCPICGHKAPSQQSLRCHVDVHKWGPNEDAVDTAVDAAVCVSLRERPIRPSSAIESIRSTKDETDSTNDIVSPSVVQCPDDSEDRSNETLTQSIASPIGNLMRRSKRKSRMAAKIISMTPTNSSDFYDNNGWLEENSDNDTSGQVITSSQVNMKSLMTSPISRTQTHVTEGTSRVSTSGRHWTEPSDSGLVSERSTPSEPLQRPSTTTSGLCHASSDSYEGDVVDYVLSHADKLNMCKYCKVIYTDQTMYYLHMGLHNLNNPWQCNLCGKVCSGVHEFTTHVIHY